MHHIWLDDLVSEILPGQKPIPHEEWLDQDDDYSPVELELALQERAEIRKERH